MVNMNWVQNALISDKKYNEEFVSRLRDTDCKEVEKTQNVLLFFKLKYTEFEFTPEFAQQYVSQYIVKRYENALTNFIYNESKTEDGILIFTYARTPDQEAIANAKVLKNCCSTILNTFRSKQDNASYNNKVTEFVSELENKVKLEAIGDYGVVFSHSITKFPTFSQEDKQKFDYFQNELSPQPELEQAKLK